MKIAICRGTFVILLIPVLLLHYSDLCATSSKPLLAPAGTELFYDGKVEEQRGDDEVYPKERFVEFLSVLEEHLLIFADQWKNETNAKISFFETNPIWTAFITLKIYSLHTLNDMKVINVTDEQMYFIIRKEFKLNDIIRRLIRGIMEDAKQNEINISARTITIELGDKMAMHAIYVLQHLSSSFYFHSPK